jgi:putative acetyltransferase
MEIMEEVRIRKIHQEDNIPLAKIIKSVLKEHDAHHGGTAFDDPETDRMFETYQVFNSRYFVAELNGRLVGGAGIHELNGKEKEYCELQKMYLLPETRGVGIGKALMETCLEFAKQSGYQYCYLETLCSMKAAQALYRKFGFEMQDKPVGETGHFGCNVWMLKKL